jgi:hypothetical protein
MRSGRAIYVASILDFERFSVGGYNRKKKLSLTERILMIPYITSMTKEKRNETQSSFSASSEISMEESFVRRGDAF